MPLTQPDPIDSFQYAGRFAGFFRDVFGNSRIVLKTADEELFLGIGKPLRKHLSRMLVPDQEIVLEGQVRAGTRLNRVVSRAWIAGKPIYARSMRICTKKKCWRAGGKEIWETLSQRIAELGMGEAVKLKEVDCLENCRHGPNLECGGSLFEHCTARNAVEILNDSAFESVRAHPAAMGKF